MDLVRKAYLLGLSDMLVFIASTNPGPTKTSRLMYLWFFMMGTAYQWVHADADITGTVDGWNWNINRQQHTRDEVFREWIGMALTIVMPKLISGYDSSKITSITGLLSAASATRLGASDWQSAVGLWFSDRTQDGSSNTSQPPLENPVYNVLTTGNPASFPDPLQWTRLLVWGKSQKYLTPYWQTVRAPIITPADELIINEEVDWYYTARPSDRADEIANLVRITGSLTDEQKLTAEFWAGGPGTVSPPGMFLWIWSKYVSIFPVTTRTFFLSGLDLAVHLFETSRLVWGLKLQDMQCRPIQDIRRLYADATIKSFKGTDISGSAWTPYQEETFVTPPFPDFPSGHSAFSQSFACMMNGWFGPKIPDSEPQRFDTPLLSPIFPYETLSKFCEFRILERCSKVQTELPGSYLILRWSTWQEIANSAGISRKYGGIHCTSAHTGGQALSKKLHDCLVTNWPALVKP